ncbi:hypothetical protein YC2023_098270 [Brassica napus]
MMVKEVESMNTVSASSMVVFSAQPLCGDIESTQVEENQEHEFMLVAYVYKCKMSRYLKRLNQLPLVVG